MYCIILFLLHIFAVPNNNENKNTFKTQHHEKIHYRLNCFSIMYDFML